MLTSARSTRIVRLLTHKYVAGAATADNLREGGEAGRRGLIAALCTAAVVAAVASRSPGCSEKDSLREDEDGTLEFSSIVVGGGTAGCLTAYLHAKWLHDRGIKKNVLLIERGDNYSPTRGPNPKMGAWYDNWGSFGEAHASLREDGSEYPVTGSDHRGLGGCGTHDTRITFQPTPRKKKELAAAMGWSEDRIDRYYQAALDMIPIERAISKPEKFYQEVINSLTTGGSNHTPLLSRLAEDHYRTEIVVDSVAENSVAMYRDETRWTSALLLQDGVRPPNLVVLSNVTADRAVLEADHDTKEINAIGVVVRHCDGEENVLHLESGGLLAVTAGAIGTPAFLQRSGVGPEDLLKNLDIKEVVKNNEVGHGVDHIEVGLMFLPGKVDLTRGGAMGWPLSLFLSTTPVGSPSIHNNHPRNTFVQCHFGAGTAEPYTDTEAIVCTPSCTEPDHGAGYRVRILSKDPKQSTTLVHAEQTRDLHALYNGIYVASKYCTKLQEEGLMGERISPPISIDLKDEVAALDWIRENHFTVYHWACTCQAGLNGRVADEHFRVLRQHRHKALKSGTGVIGNMFVGSAAALPDLPEANPHLTIAAFSFALAQELHMEACRRHSMDPIEPEELVRARSRLLCNKNKLAASPAGNEIPNLGDIAAAHEMDWKKCH